MLVATSSKLFELKEIYCWSYKLYKEQPKSVCTADLNGAFKEKLTTKVPIFVFLDIFPFIGSSLWLLMHSNLNLATNSFKLAIKAPFNALCKF